MLHQNKYIFLLSEVVIFLISEWRALMLLRGHLRIDIISAHSNRLISAKTSSFICIPAFQPQHTHTKDNVENVATYRCL